MSDKKINRRPQVRNAWDGKWIVVDSNEQSVKGIYLDCLCVDGKWRPGPIDQRHIFRTEADAHLAMASWMKGEVPISERDAHLAALRTAAGEFFSSVMKPHPNWPTANSVFDALCDERREGKDASVREWATKNILRIEAAVSVLNPLLPDYAKQPATKSEGWSAYDDLESELKTVTAQRDAAVERLREVRDVVMDAINSSPIHVRDDHSQNCRWCKVRAIIDSPTLPATEAGGGVCSELAATAASKDSAPAGDFAKRLKSPQGRRHHRVECECDICYPPAHELDRTVAALRARLDAAGVVVGILRAAVEYYADHDNWRDETAGTTRDAYEPGWTKAESAITAARAWKGGGE